MGNSFQMTLVVRLALILVAAGLFIETFGFRQLTDSAFGPASWPRIVLVLLALSATADLWFSARVRPTDRALGPGPINWRMVAFLVLMLIAYIGGMSVVGFPLATLLFCMAFLVLHGFREPMLVVLIALAMSAVMILIFVKVLYLALPRGVWAFYDLTNLIFELIGR